MNRLPKIFLVLFAAAALLLTLSTPALAGGEMKGKIMSVNADNLGFVMKTDAQGKTLRFDMDEDASVFINNVEKSLSDLHSGDHVDIIYRQEGDEWLAIEVRCDRK